MIAQQKMQLYSFFAYLKYIYSFFVLFFYGIITIAQIKQAVFVQNTKNSANGYAEFLMSIDCASDVFYIVNFCLFLLFRICQKVCFRPLFRRNDKRL